MSILFCDTNCELWYTKAEELGLKVIKMPYILDNEEFYYDLGKATDFKHFYERLKAGSMPTTAALNEFNYKEYFEPVLKEGNDIFYITFSHKLSATFNFMDTAITELKKKYPERKITIFDTKSISMGAGLQVYYAAKLWKSGATDEELLKFLNEFSPKTNAVFCVDSLFHLKRGGRISGAVAFAGTLFGLKPVLSIVEEGSIKNINKVKGAKKVINYLAEVVKNDGEDLDKYDIYVVHANVENEALELQKKLYEILGDKVNIEIQIVGPVIATHCGVGTLGVIFKGKKRMSK